MEKIKEKGKLSKGKKAFLTVTVIFFVLAIIINAIFISGVADMVAQNDGETAGEQAAGVLLGSLVLLPLWIIGATGVFIIELIFGGIWFRYSKKIAAVTMIANALLYGGAWITLLTLL